ncbi:unnamed protein product [Prorocentrum cordatum]|uniref:tRNA-binding domain-containing protein n=1 Tax=Prorocentrum cordatum TaxID=2364126 RepID=A0ABN9RCN2_9DINO|nr:unnamed protein product [Polarella glacialis]
MARDIVDAGGGLATLLRAGDWASSAFEADGMKEGFATTWSPVGKELPPGHTDYSWEKAVAASKPAPAPAKKPKKVGGGAEASAKKAPEPPPVGGGTRDEDDDAAAKIALIVGRVTKVWEHPDSDKLFCEEIDCGESEIRQIGSGLRAFYKKEDQGNHGGGRVWLG